MAKSKGKTFYVTSEESAQQTQLRARWLGVSGKDSAGLKVLAETNLEKITKQIGKHAIGASKRLVASLTSPI